MSDDTRQRFEHAQIAIGLTEAPDGTPLLWVEAGGYFQIPATVQAQLAEFRPQLSQAHEQEMAARFVLHAMLGNQAE